MVILSLFVSKFSFVKKMIHDRDVALAFVVGAFLFVGAAIALFVFLFLYHGFLFLKGQQVFGPVLTVYTLEAGFALVFSLLMITSVSSGLVILFRSQELTFLASRPLSFIKLFYYGLLKNYLISSWPILVLAFPALLALGLSYAQPIAFYLLGAFGIILLSVGAVLLGSGLALVIGYVIPRASKGYFVIILLALLVLTGYVFAGSLVPVNFQDMFRAELLEEEIVSSRDIERNFSPWPTHRYVNLLRSFLENNVSGAVQNLALIATGVGVIFFIVSLWARATYRTLWAKFQERTFVAGEKSKGGHKSSFPRFLPGEIGLITSKDLLTLSRNFSNLYSVGFLLFLLFVYAFTVSRVLTDKDVLSPEKFSLVLAFTIAVIGYFAAIFALRFVFPSVSQEGRGAWITWSSPLHLKTIVWAKFLFYSFLFFVLLEGLFLFSVRSLGLDTSLMVLLSSIIFLIVLTINGIALGLGTAFPNFNLTDAERLSTTPGGLATIFVSISYISITAFFVYILMSEYLVLRTIPLYIFTIMILLSLVLVFSFLKLALNKIRYIG